MIQRFIKRERKSRHFPKCTSIAASLPPELIISIIRLSIKDETQRGAYNILYNLSLLSRTWGTEARVILWSKVILGTRREVEAFSKSPALGAYTTVYLSLCGTNQRVSANTVEKILSRVKGIKHLRLTHFWKEIKLSVRVLRFNNLRGLTTLEVIDSVLHKTLRSPPGTFIPLQRLTISPSQQHWFGDPLPIPLGFYQHYMRTLTELVIEFHMWTRQSDEVDRLLRLIGFRLKLLILILPFPTPTLPSSLSTCGNLVKLTLSIPHGEDLVQMMQNLSCHLTSFTLRSNFRKHESIIRGMCTVLDYPCMAGLKRLRLFHYTMNTLMQNESGGELVDRVRARGIELKFAPSRSYEVGDSDTEE